MSTAPSRRLTIDQYLELEERASYRSEFYRGEMFAMAGASWRHQQIIGNFEGALRQRLRGKPCRPAANEIKVFIKATGLFTYPDVLVVCGDRQKFRDREDIVVNPKLIIEVLSDSTEAYDRGEKFRQYQQLDSLAEYILVSQKNISIDCFSRGDNTQWLLRSHFSPGDVLRLPSIDCEIPIAEIYEEVELPTLETSSPPPVGDRRPS